jgi:hypothetical protein
MSSRRRVVFNSVILSCAIFITSVGATFATTSVDYNFDTASDLTANFNGYVNAGVAQQELTGGVSNSGAINAPGSANAVFTTKSSYSIGPIGSSYTFTSFLQSVGNAGYSGVGFTATQIPGAGNNSGFPYKPNDALGISVHGGGFVLHNGATSVNGSWASENAGVTSIKKATISDLLNSGSPDKWYKLVFKLTRDSNTTFDARFEIWPSYSTGVLIRPLEADAIFEWPNVANTELINSPSIYSYINFSGDRVRYFDDYKVELAGGSSVVVAGSPVVLTSSAVDNSGVVSFAGDVTSDGGSSVTDRGFVYGTAPSPTVSDSKVSSGSSVGAFTGTTSTLPAGTYYFRSYATNSVGVTYGSEVQVTIAGSTPVAVVATPTVPLIANAYRADKLATVYFSPLSSKLSKSAKNQLEAAVIANPSAVYKITGYVQKSIFAKNAKNDASLSLARAKAIETHLESLGAGVTFTVVVDAAGVPAKNGKSDKARRATLYAMTPVVQ